MSLTLHHISLPVRDVDRALGFYSEVLGLPTLARPDFSFAGAWLGAADRQIHLIETDTDDPAADLLGAAAQALLAPASARGFAGDNGSYSVVECA